MPSHRPRRRGPFRAPRLPPATPGLTNDHLDAAGHGLDEAGALFGPVRPQQPYRPRLEGAITADGIYRLVRLYSAQLGFQIGAHALRATAATYALDHQVDIAKAQEWLGHADIAPTRIDDRGCSRPEDSASFMSLDEVKVGVTLSGTASSRVFRR